MANYWFKFEWDAWLNDRRLARCSFETQGFWVKCICLMEESGECFIDGEPEEVANLLGCSMDILRRCVGELKKTGTAEIVSQPRTGESNAGRSCFQGNDVRRITTQSRSVGANILC